MEQDSLDKNKKEVTSSWSSEKTVNDLIKKLQKSYFKTKKISETEYRIKLKKYEELLREIERKTMILREELYKKKNDDRFKEFKIKTNKKKVGENKTTKKRLKKKISKNKSPKKKIVKKKIVKKKEVRKRR